MHVIGNVSRPLVEIPRAFVKRHKTILTSNQEIRNFKFFSTSQDNALSQKQQEEEDTKPPTHEEIAKASDYLISKLKKKFKNIPKMKNNTAENKTKWTKQDNKIVKETIKDSIRKAKKHDLDKDGFILMGKEIKEIEEFIMVFEEPKYRALQIQKSILNGSKTIDEIKSIPKALKERLKETGVKIGRSVIHTSMKTTDDTEKFLLQLRDGLVVEAVGVPATRSPKPRLTACISSQVGCPLKCSFCATGKGGYSRNLYAHEIVDQVLTIQEQMKRRVTNVVFMGMGEPLLNMNQVVKAFEILNEQIGIGARNITISTVGVPNTIRKLAAHKLQLTLAVSLHAPNQKLRETLVPSAKGYPLDELLKDCRMYFKSTGRRVTFEYTLLDNINDSEEHARELACLLESYYLRTHINLLQWNPVDGMDYKRPSMSKAEVFKKILEDNLFPVTIRKSRGLEKMAACGQLSNVNQKIPLSQYETLT